MPAKITPKSHSTQRAFTLDDCNFTVAEAAQHLRISRGYFYKLVDAGKIKPVKCGRRTLIPGAELRRFMSALAA